VSSFFCQGQNQYIYSIDIKPTKERRVPVKYYIEQVKLNVKTSNAIKEKHRVLRKNSKKIRKRTYNIQTHAVKKRMRKSLKEAENYNRGKMPLRVKLIKLFNNG
jgi:hypothetical protein